MKEPPLIIGLTGGIAAGKTTVSQHFAAEGVPVIDADVIAHDLVQPGQPALNFIVETFGTDILNATGQLDRKKLRQCVFAHPAERQRLEAILHPRVFALMQAQVKQVRTPYCLLSIPLLVETRQTAQVDRVLVVDCPVELQYQRLKTRNGFTTIEIEQILATQTSRAARLAIAHDVIYNDSYPYYLQQRVLALHQMYLKLAESNYKRSWPER